MSKNKKVTFKSTAILLGILIILLIIKISMASKNKIGEIEVRKVEVKAEELVKIPAYAVDKDSDSPRKYAISTKEAATSDLLQVAVQDMTKNYSEDLELKNIYFSDTTVYYEFNKKDLSEGFMQALQMVTEEIMGISEINFIK
ncbi:hypothetical protein [Fusobacterium pseudoperiodonticum]|uniref:hypothetical protein n=1 Tax=Fusobacterium pseudoperiodonticum TaxID=2663009 RepID=UPI000C1B8CEA|nr:hypothetical protein [Fusobacterium pseudoperiodonticum]ATV56334.1 hypothetical protein CTM68_00530 [Fusobacterium pseudoperiodonticum]ATV67144.1 hypothetical protein CTM92_00025 [Fusobacterium pseudoperiodonticum]